MGIFDKITRGIGKGIGNAIGNATQKAVEKKAAEVLTPKINQAADTIAGNAARGSSSSLEGALGNLEGAMSGYATRAMQNMKVCPACETACSADKKFCPSCGGPLPEKTLAQDAVCPNCGKQNQITEKFCSDCGTKLPIVAAAENRQKQADDSVLAQWTEKLPAYPVWTIGGREYSLDNYDVNYYVFSVRLRSVEEAHRAVATYRTVLQQSGFRMAGQYPSIEHLYKRVDGVVYHVDTEHCFEGDSDRPSIGFDQSEPLGGFDYVKPEPKKKGLFGFFK